MDGLAYDDQWGAVFKGGLNLHPRLGLEGLINLGQTAADLEASSPEAFGGGFLDLEEGGLFANDNRTTGQINAYYYLAPGKTGLGLGLTRIIDADNAIDFDNTLSISFFHKWTGLF